MCRVIGSTAALLATATCIAVGSTAALAAPPGVEHFTDTFTDVDTDFCGTGETVIFSGEVRGTGFTQPNQDVDYWEVSRGFVTITNPDNGATVTNHWANRFTDVVISGDEEGIHTHRATVIGLPEQYRLSSGGAITLDAGLIVIEQTFDGGVPEQ
jgi:hypothetical protein